jgi:hypothetical protein
MKPTSLKRLDLIAVKWLKRAIAFWISLAIILAIVGWGAIIMGVR